MWITHSAVSDAGRSLDQGCDLSLHRRVSELSALPAGTLPSMDCYRLLLTPCTGHSRALLRELGRGLPGKLLRALPRNRPCPLPWKPLRGLPWKLLRALPGKLRTGLPRQERSECIASTADQSAPWSAHLTTDLS